MIDVVAIGELLIDFSPLSVNERGCPAMQANPGGAPCNYLSALSRYGKKTAFIGKVGDDAFGRLLRASLEQEGVELRGLISDPEVFTTLAFVAVDPRGDRSFSFARKPGADTCLRYEEIDLGLVDEAKVLHFGTLSLTDEPARTATERLVDYAREKGKLISFDPNLRPPLWKSKQEAAARMLWGLGKADVVKISDDEVDFLFDCDEREAAQKIISEFGVKLAMVTLGSRGCWLSNGGASCFVPAPSVKAVDTTGAGDIFGGSAMKCLLDFGLAPDKLSRQQLEYMGRFACTAASLSTLTPGGIPSIPALSAVEKLLEST